MLWSTMPHQNHQDVSSVIQPTKQEHQEEFLYFGYLGLFYLSICFGPNIIVRWGLRLFQMEKRSKKEENEPLKRNYNFYKLIAGDVLYSPYLPFF